MSSESPASIDRVRTVAVLGAGTMGHGIAQVAAMAGYRVYLYDVTDDAVKAGRSRIEKNLDKGVKLGKVAADLRDRALAAISLATAIGEAVAEADVVVEAAPEKLDLKKQIFGEVAAAAPAHAVLATNTSSLSVASIADGLPRPSHLVGMHFFNPVHIMKLVEVVRHDGADPVAVATAVALAEKMGKTPITVADAPGFASSRLGLVLGLEAIRMVEQGVASAADIDTAMKLGYGHPMGPLELTDLVGLDIRLHIADYLAGEIGEHFRPPELLRKLVDDGRLGKKSGHGFYRWQDGKKVAD
jgi:3-hydroxybutyryl-CoA dehydrogenase